MHPTVIREFVAEATRLADPTPAVTAAVIAKRKARSEEFDEVHAVTASGDFHTMGYRSPTAWLATITGESIGHCKATISMADKVQQMPIVKATFSDGRLAESNLRLLCEAWNGDVAEQFAHDESMLCRWAVELPNKDFRLVLDTWRMHADPDREERTAEQQFDERSLHLSRLLDDVGRIDGNLDPEGFQLVREAIRALSRPAEGETRTAAQRRADALTEMARIALGSLEPEPGRKRQRPKVIATIAYDDLAANSNGGVIDTDHDAVVAPAETIRRLACDCDVHRYVTNPMSTPIDFGRRQRVVPDSLFDVLMIRDHGCRWPGCGIPAGSCDAHHAIHWLDDGETEPDNLVLLCRYHHHLLHEQHWSIEPLGAGHFTVHSPRGDSQFLRPPLVGLALPTQPQLPPAAGR